MKRLLTAVSLSLLVMGAAQAQVLPEKWCSDVQIRFFAGGAEGDLFATIVLNGAKQAQADTGAQVEFMFSGWQGEKMVQQLREAIASRPDGIAMMGHPGNSAIMPLAEEAAAAGILMEYQNVDVPEVRAKFGGGYVGANLQPQGRALGAEAVRLFKLGKGDKAIMVANWTQEERVLRELGTVEALEEAGVEVIRLSSNTEMAGDPNLAIPLITAGLIANPEVKLIAYPGGAMLGNASVYMEVGRQEAGRDHQYRLRHQPADRRAIREGLGAAVVRPAAVPAGLSADPGPLPAKGARARGAERRHRRRLHHTGELPATFPTLASRSSCVDICRESGAAENRLVTLLAKEIFQWMSA